MKYIVELEDVLNFLDSENIMKHEMEELVDKLIGNEYLDEDDMTEAFADAINYRSGTSYSVINKEKLIKLLMEG